MEECLSEVVEISIAYRVSKMANGDCSNLNIDSFRDIEENRNSKRRFLKNAVKGFNDGETISSSLFDSLESSGPEVTLDKNNVCDFVSKKSAAVAKEMMADCPKGAELFQVIIRHQNEMEKVSDINLSSVCHKVVNMKEEACRDSKIFYKSCSEESSLALPGKIKNNSNGSRASAQ